MIYISDLYQILYLLIEIFKVYVINRYVSYSVVFFIIIKSNHMVSILFELFGQGYVISLLYSVYKEGDQVESYVFVNRCRKGRIVTLLITYVARSLTLYS